MGSSFSVDIKPGSPAQVNVGILAKVVITLSDDNGPVMVVNDAMIRNGPTGPFVAYPQIKSNKKDENGKDMYFPIIKFFPNDKKKFEDFSQKIVQKYKNTVGQGNTAAPVTSKPKVVKQEPVKVPASSDLQDLDFTM